MAPLNTVSIINNVIHFIILFLLLPSVYIVNSECNLCIVYVLEYIVANAAGYCVAQYNMYL